MILYLRSGFYMTFDHYLSLSTDT